MQLNFKLSVKSQIWSSTHAALLKVVQCNAIYLIGLRCIKNPVQLLVDTSLRFCEGDCGVHETLLLNPGELSLELARVIKEDVHQTSLQLEDCL